MTKEEFVAYFNNISCSIEDDVYFDELLKNCWGLRKTKKVY